MPVDIYVGRDRDDDMTRTPDYNHEMKGVQEICDAMRDRFGESSAYYAVLVSPQHVEKNKYFRADMIIISEKGLGILELKHHAGILDCHRDKAWFMRQKNNEKTFFKSDKDVNPHKQVQRYGGQVYEKITKAGSDWIEVNDRAKQYTKLQTAVCFTNINANIDKCQADVERYYQNPATLARWEKDFSVLHPDEVPAWAIRLRFEVWPERKGVGIPFNLSPAQIDRLATELFECRKWLAMMDRPKPQAYLHIMKEGNPRHIFRLTRNHYVIGRDPSCNLLMPQRFENISRKHASLTFKQGDYYLDDGDAEDENSESMNGTFVGKQRRQVKKGQPVALKDGVEIMLGDESCLLYYSKTPISLVKTTMPKEPDVTIALVPEKEEPQSLWERIKEKLPVNFGHGRW